MNLLPDILDEMVDGSHATFCLFVPKEFVHFSGHFPGQPILPGIVQLDWVVRLGERHFPLPRDRFSHIKNLKFTSPLLPETELTLSLHWQTERQRLEFSYQAGTRTCSSGHVVFGAAA